MHKEITPNRLAVTVLLFTKKERLIHNDKIQNKLFEKELLNKTLNSWE